MTAFRGDDEYWPDERQHLPLAWWRMPDDIRLRVRIRRGEDPDLAFHTDFFTSLSVYGPLYIDLAHLTLYDTYQPGDRPLRAAHLALTGQFPQLFTMVHHTSPGVVYLTLRLHRFTDPIADAILTQRAATLTALGIDPAAPLWRRMGEAGVVRGSRQRLESIVAEQLSPAGRLQVNTALVLMDVLAEHLDRLRRRLLATARHVNGARALIDAIYGVGPLTSLALCSWLGGADRFSSSRKAVRFVGLDITVHSSDAKRSPGRLSRQGPEVLRWLLFEAAKTSARSCAPGYGYYTDVKERYDANRAALSQARRIVRQAAHILTDLGEDAFTIIAQPAAPTMVTR
jgi:transposase